MTRPCVAPITTPFGFVPGYPLNNGYHNGVDYGCGLNTPLKACIGGVVTFVGNQGGYGKFVEFRGDNGRYYLYAHMNRTDVVNGSRIGEGIIVGLSGSTGASTGPHVHVMEAGNKTNNQLNDLMDFEANFTGGGNMDKITLDSGRQLFWGVLGRNGLAGRSNALDGSSDAAINEHYIGHDLSNAIVSQIFLSEESRRYRDAPGPTSNTELQKRYDAYPGLVTQVADLKKQVKDLEEQLAEAGSGDGEFKKVLSAGDDLYAKVS